MTLKDSFFAILVCFIWGINFVVIKKGLQDLPPFLFIALRYVIAATPILFIKKPSVPLRIIVGFGFFLGVVKFSGTFCGIHCGVGAGICSLLIQIHVLFTIILSFLIFKKSLFRNQIIGIIVSCVGIIIIGIEMNAQSNFSGFMMVMGAALAWAIANIIVQMAPSCDPFSLIVWSSLIPPLPLYSLSYFFDQENIVYSLTHISFLGIGCLLYTAIFATWLGASLWAKLLIKYPAATVVPYSFLIPIFGLLSGVIICNESLSFTTGFASFIVLLGLIINQRLPKVSLN